MASKTKWPNPIKQQLCTTKNQGLKTQETESQGFLSIKKKGSGARARFGAGRLTAATLRERAAIETVEGEVAIEAPDGGSTAVNVSPAPQHGPILHANFNLNLQNINTTVS